MPATAMTTRAAASRSPADKQPVETRDADVVEAVDLVAHHLGGDRRLFGHRYVRCARCGDQNDTLAGYRVRPAVR